MAHRVLFGLTATVLSAATIGKSVPPPPLTAERVASLPSRERGPWLAYLDRSARQRKSDRAALDAELKSGGLAEPLAPPSGSAARSLPLDRPADWYGSAEARRIAAIVVSFQTPAGGWSKNLNMADHQRRKGEHYAANNLSKYLAPGDFDAPHDPGWNYVGTLDNDATTTQLRFLARVISAGAGDVTAFRDSFLRGIRYLLDAQYPNGGWPQVWPLEGGYHDAITFNDGAIGETLRVLSAVAAGKGDYAFVPAAVRKEAAQAVARGIDCILSAQVKVGGELTVWGQQHDPLTLQPVAARNYEPAALCSAESAGLVQVLLSVTRPDPRIARAVDSAAAWFRKTAISGRRYGRTPEGRGLQPDAAAPLLWARFYQIGTNRPIFGDRDQSIHDTLQEISAERRNGYSWYVTTPQAVLDAVKPR